METKVEVSVSDIERKEQPLIDKGIYTAEISNVEKRPVNASDGSHPDYVYVTYTITKPKAGSFDGVTVRDSMPAKASPNSKLGMFMVAAGMSLKGKSAADISSILLHRKVEIMVGPRSYKDRKTGENRIANDVKSVDFL